MMVLPNKGGVVLACAVMLGAVAVPVAALAQSGELAAGISYSDRYGATGSLGLRFDDLMEGALDASITHRSGEKGSDTAGSLAYTHQLGDTALGADSVVRLRLSGLNSDWSVNPYDTQSLDVLVGVGAALNPNTRWSVNLVHNTSRLTQRGGTVPAILAQDFGSSQATWVEMGLSWTNAPDAGLFDQSLSVSGLIASTIDGDAGREWQSVSLSVAAVQPLGARLAFALTGDAQVVAPQSDGGRVHVIDRVFANGRQPRGFGWGSPGPVDPVTEDALGGTRQVSASAELRAPLPREGLSIAVFFDMGSVWDLSGDAVAGLDDSYALRSSAGIALRMQTAIGLFEMALSEPIKSSAFDVAQPVSLSFVAEF
jgi:outer membrane protein assembly factor BamA